VLGRTNERCCSPAAIHCGLCRDRRAIHPSVYECYGVSVRSSGTKAVLAHPLNPRLWVIAVDFYGACDGSGLPPIADRCACILGRHPVPCVDGSELARKIFTLGRWSVPPCVRPFDAVHMTAGHNALRGSGPGQIPAFDNAVALVGPRAPQPAHRRGAAPAPLTIASAVRAVEDGHVP
jgi:hypothetical protein